MCALFPRNPPFPPGAGPGRGRGWGWGQTRPTWREVKAWLPLGSWKRRHITPLRRRRALVWGEKPPLSLPSAGPRVLPVGPLCPAAPHSWATSLCCPRSLPHGRLLCERAGYVKALLGVSGFSAVAAQPPRSPGRRPGPREVAAERALRVAGPQAPAPSALTLGFGPRLLGRDLSPRLSGPPAHALGRQGRGAAWDAEAPGRGGGRGRAGAARGAEEPARRWRLRGSLCGLIGLKRS